VTVNQYIKRYTGFQAILSNRIKNPVKAIVIYRDKDVVEKYFDELKNQLDMKRLGMHSSAAVKGWLFIQFISFILMSSLRKELRESNLIEKYTVRILPYTD
jgi:transposase